MTPNPQRSPGFGHSVAGKLNREVCKPPHGSFFIHQYKEHT